jgi:hypothetical protein
MWWKMTFATGKPPDAGVVGGAAAVGADVGAVVSGVAGGAVAAADGGAAVGAPVAPGDFDADAAVREAVGPGFPTGEERATVAAKPARTAKTNASTSAAIRWAIGGSSSMDADARLWRNDT